MFFLYFNYLYKNYVQKQMGDSIVVTAPLYHQFTMNATLLPRDSFEMAYKVAAEDVLHQFDAYMLGYRLSRKDLLSPRICPALSATKGKVVSFNSVTSVDKQWEFISGGAVTCINPINWTVDATPAQLVYKGDTMTVSIDPKAHVLVVDTDADKAYNPAFTKWFGPGCLHTQDLLFYLPYIRENILLRLHND